MDAIRRNNLQGALFSCIVVMVLSFFLMGCDQILNEILTKDLELSENLFSSGNATGTENTILIISNQNICKNIFVPEKSMGYIIAPVEPPDAELFTTIVSNGGGRIIGTLVNNSEEEAVFKIYFGYSGNLTDLQSQATFIGSVDLSGSETKVLTGFEAFNEDRNVIISNMEAYFSSVPDVNTIYVYLTGEPLPVDITVQSLSFVLNPAYRLFKVIEPNQTYAQYVDQVEDISEVSFTGSVTNNGDSQVDLWIFVSPYTGSAVWKGELVSISIDPGETILMENWTNYVTDGAMERIEEALEYYVISGEAIQLDMILESESDLNVEIISIFIECTITVAL